MDFDRIISRKSSRAIQLEVLKDRFGSDDLIPMWVADMNFEVAPAVQKSLELRAKNPIFGYTLLDSEFFNSIYLWLKNKHNWQPDNNSVVFASSVLPSIAVAIRSFSSKGDKILIQTPVYPPFYQLIESSERLVEQNILVEDSLSYKIDFVDLEQKFASGIRLFLMCSPHNPVGRVWAKNELTQIAQLAEKYKVLVLSDEIHSDLCHSGYTHIPFASISDYTKQNTITFMSPSKSFNLAGLNTAYTIIENKELRSQFEQIQNSMHLNMGNVFGIEALISAYKHSDAWLNDVLGYIQQNIEFARDFIESEIPQLQVFKCQGTYLIWIDFRSLKMSDPQLKEFLVFKAKLALNMGVDFGIQGSGFARMNMANPRSIIAKALTQLKNAVESIS